jgi:hypothetical protein
MNPKKLFQKALRKPKNLAFEDLIKLARAFGFELVRVSGNHHILVHPDVDRPLNLQEVHGQAKPYQVRQFIRIVEENDLSLEEW